MTSATVSGGSSLPAFERNWPKFADAPAVSDKSYESTAELPGIDEKNIEVKLVNGGITIKGEKKEEKEERRKKTTRSISCFPRASTLPEDRSGAETCEEDRA